MIAGWMRALRRWLLQREIEDIEADIAGIRMQRQNDIEVEKVLTQELCVARRHLQAERLAWLNLKTGK